MKETLNTEARIFFLLFYSIECERKFLDAQKNTSTNFLTIYIFFFTFSYYRVCDDEKKISHHIFFDLSIIVCICSGGVFNKYLWSFTKQYAYIFFYPGSQLLIDDNKFVYLLLFFLNKKSLSAVINKIINFLKKKSYKNIKYICLNVLI